MFEQYDVIIAGSGIAGLYCALQFPQEKRVLVLCKDKMSETNTDLAQGGVAAVLDLSEDDYDLHIEDTLIAGHYENDPVSVNLLVKEARRTYGIYMNNTGWSLTNAPTAP